MADVTLKKVCRFCLEPDEEKLENIFGKSDESRKMPLAVQVMSCVSIEIFEGDEMPTYCCNICRNLMEVIYQYKQICRKTDMELKRCLVTGKLPGKFELPLKLIKECLVKETGSEMIDCGTNTELKGKGVTKAVQTDSEDVENVVKARVKRKLPIVPTAPIVKEEIKVETPKPKRVRVEEIATLPFQDDQIEILELTQTEVDQLQPVCIQPDNEITPVFEPVLLNKTFDQQKPEKSVIEFQKFVMKDNGDVEVEIQEGLTPVDDSIYACDMCPRTFMIKQQLELHLNKHFKERKFSCEICDSKFLSKNDLVKHSQTHNAQKPHKCVVCDRSFARPGILRRHQLQHTEHFNFHCTTCPQKFITEEELKKHVDFVHNKRRLFSCHHCDKSFAYKQGLERHMTSHDPTQKTHVCEICQASFSTPNKLQQHLPKHAGKRRYPCKYCTKAFILSHHLSRHVRNAHNSKPKLTELTITSYTCIECNQIFQNRDTFVKHTVEHTTQSLTCPLCKIKFETLDQVDSHIEEHAMASDHYSCELCSCAYLTEHLLEKHFEEVHNGVVVVNMTEDQIQEGIEIEGEEFLLEEEIKEEKQVTPKKKSTDIQQYFDKLPKCVTIKRKSK